jgi:hypothetical protein
MDGSLVFALSFVQALASTFLFKFMGKYSDRRDKISLLFKAKGSRVLLFGLYVIAIPILAFNSILAIIFLLLIHLHKLPHIYQLTRLHLYRFVYQELFYQDIVPNILCVHDLFVFQNQKPKYHLLHQLLLCELAVILFLPPFLGIGAQ